MNRAKPLKDLGLALALAGAVSALAGCDEDATPKAIEGSAKAAKLSSCVRPTEFMRHNHMELIKHQRNLTVHQGIRKTDLSLAGCIDCHVQYDARGRAVPVNAEGQFCDKCHDYAAVELTCFQCHAAVPNGPYGQASAERAARSGHRIAALDTESGDVGGQ